MDQIVSERPTSGASTAELAAQLHEVRARTHRLTDDLSSEQLMGLKLDIVNPVLWEIGHVGWFHEYWTLRHSLGQRPLIERADDLWNSSTVAHDTRWSLDLPDRNGTFAYLAGVLERQCDHLARGSGADDRAGHAALCRHCFSHGDWQVATGPRPPAAAEGATQAEWVKAQVGAGVVAARPLLSGPSCG